MVNSKAASSIRRSSVLPVPCNPINASARPACGWRPSVRPGRLRTGKATGWPLRKTRSCSTSAVTGRTRPAGRHLACAQHRAGEVSKPGTHRWDPSPCASLLSFSAGDRDNKGMRRMSAASFPPVACNLRASSPGPHGVTVVPGPHLPRRNVERGWHQRAARHCLGLQPAGRRSGVIHGAGCRQRFCRAVRRGSRGDSGGWPSW